MVVYKCDGDSFGGGKCSNEVTREMPDWWLMISGKIKNGLRDAHYLEANGTYHFCSRRCFENFFFKNENAASAITGNSDMLQNQLDPGTKQEETQEQAAEVAEATEQSAELENAEEGTTEG